MAQPQRVQRVADLLQQELAVILQRELTDPRLGFITVTGVDVSRDLASARVYVSCLSLHINNAEEAEKTAAEQVTLLQNSVGFIRRLLGQRVKLRVVPQLRFIYDDTTSRANALGDLIDRTIKRDDGVDDN